MAPENVDKVAQLMGSLEDGKVAGENSLKVIDFKGKKYIVFNWIVLPIAKAYT